MSQVIQADSQPLSVRQGDTVWAPYYGYFREGEVVEVSRSHCSVQLEQLDRIVNLKLALVRKRDAAAGGADRPPQLCPSCAQTSYVAVPGGFGRC